MRIIKFKNYLWKYALLVAVMFVASIAINWAVDPYNEFGNNHVGIFYSSERQAKNKIQSFPHDAILIGSSKTAHIDPDDLCGHQFYNASFSEALPEEMYYYLKKYAYDVKLVAIGLDFFMFNETGYPLKELESWPMSYNNPLEYLVSFDVFKKSLVAVYKRIAGFPPKVDPDGFRNTFYKDREDTLREEYEYDRTLELLGKKHYHDFRLSRQRLEYLRKIRDLLDERQIRLQVFLNPLNAKVERLVKQKGSWDDFRAWKEDVYKIFGNVTDLTTGEYSHLDLYYKDDPVHYKPETGAQFMNIMLACDPSAARYYSFHQPPATEAVGISSQP